MALSALAIFVVVSSALDFRSQFAPPAVAADPLRGVEILDGKEEDVLHTREMGVALDFTASPVAWRFYEAAGRERGFLVSTNLVYRETSPGQGEIIDMDKEQPQLRSSIPNWYLLKYRLEYEYENVGELDPDRDYFTNEEEYQYSNVYGVEFDPTDPQSHPPYYLKLSYSEFSTDSYILDFSSGTDPYMIRHIPDEGQPGRWTAFAEAGVPFGSREGADAERFLIHEVEDVTVEVPGGQRVIKQLTIEDLKREPEDHRLRNFTITQGEQIDLETRSAIFSFPTGSFTVEEFGTFEFTGVEGPEFLLEEVTEENVTISFADDEGVRHQLEIPRGGTPEPHVD